MLAKSCHCPWKISGPQNKVVSSFIDEVDERRWISCFLLFHLVHSTYLRNTSDNKKNGFMEGSYIPTFHHSLFACQCVASNCLSTCNGVRQYQVVKKRGLGNSQGWCCNMFFWTMSFICPRKIQSIVVGVYVKFWYGSYHHSNVAQIPTIHRHNRHNRTLSPHSIFLQLWLSR